jgi:hypothetical protein
MVTVYTGPCASGTCLAGCRRRVSADHRDKPKPRRAWSVEEKVRAVADLPIRDRTPYLHAVIR